MEESLEIIRTIFHSDTMWAVEWKETGEAIGCVGYLPAAVPVRVMRLERITE